jgi:hypothetical protein
MSHRQTDRAAITKRDNADALMYMLTIERANLRANKLAYLLVKGVYAERLGRRCDPSFAIISRSEAEPNPSFLGRHQFIVDK